MRIIESSFRDPSGAVYEDNGRILRSINECYRGNWEELEKNGLIKRLTEEKKLVAHREIEPMEGAWKGLEAERIPFLSWPHEWGFAQLRDAALLTLELQKRALAEGFVLKDGSAYNVQFNGSSPVFIDLLSFEKWRPGSPWEAYRQFCSHFLAPLALMSYLGAKIGRITQTWINGAPLPLIAKMLPARARLNPGLAMHLFFHSKVSENNSDGRKSSEKVKKINMDLAGLLDIANSLERTIKKLKLPREEGEWSDYYSDTNYSDEGMRQKAETISEWAREHPGEVVIDLGANTGYFSRRVAPFFKTVIAVDFDSVAVNRHYESLKRQNSNILPLTLDLANPSPAIGWGNEERASFTQRASGDLVMMLALCHHLVIAEGAPFPKIANWTKKLVKKNGFAIIEFVPKSDSQIQRMLAAREDIFQDYNIDMFLASFSSAGFKEVERKVNNDNGRSLHLFQSITY